MSPPPAGRRRRSCRRWYGGRLAAARLTPAIPCRTPACHEVLPPGRALSHGDAGWGPSVTASASGAIRAIRAGCHISPRSQTPREGSCTSEASDIKKGREQRYRPFGNPPGHAWSTAVRRALPTSGRLGQRRWLPRAITGSRHAGSASGEIRRWALSHRALRHDAHCPYPWAICDGLPVPVALRSVHPHSAERRCCDHRDH